MTDLLAALARVVGAKHVLVGDAATRPYRTGYRFGGGSALAAVLPGSLVEQWRVLEICVAHDVIVIAQAANTGLTGGSTPHGDDYDRPVIILSMRRLKGVHLLDHGNEVVCLPGATLYELEARLAPLGREPHSVIGSSCIGASVVGGICNNSGGSLIRRGPAYTELALYGRVSETGQLELVNHLGLELGGDPEDVLGAVERGEWTSAAFDAQERSSTGDYVSRVRDIESDTPARFNADPERLFEASGSAGKVIIFAVRLQTFPRDETTAVFYIGTNDPQELTEIRRHVLAHFRELPVSAEYLHRTAFDVADRYGKDAFLAIEWLGTQHLPTLYSFKAKFDRLTSWMRLGGEGVADRLLQRLASLAPDHLPRRMREWRTRFEHHLILKMSGSGINDARSYLSRIMPSTNGGMFECTPKEARKALLHRFVTAGAAVRYRQTHPGEVEDIVALDIALPRNTRDWREVLPDAIARDVVHALYYGHFFCHVFHQDYIIRKGADPLRIEHAMWVLLDARGAEYPAEHNVGHLYPAKSELANFYQNLDPTNAFNPGIGQTSKRKNWS